MPTATKPFFAPSHVKGPIDGTAPGVLHRTHGYRLFVVVPAFNEARVIGEVLDDLATVVPPQRIIVVDDGSWDDTGRIAREHGALTLRHLINRGQGAALATGIRAALLLGAEIIVTFDADGQHSASDIPTLVEPIIKGESDVVLGNRFSNGKPPGIRNGRYVALKLAVLYTRFFSGIKIRDCHNGLRALSRRAAEIIRIRQDGMAHASEILEEIVRRRVRFVERPVSIRYTDYSSAKGQKTLDAVALVFRLLAMKLFEIDK